MAKVSEKRRAFLLKQLADQQKWVDEHGGDRAGYVERYGVPGDEKCYGNGGEAIYRADLNELVRCLCACVDAGLVDLMKYGHIIAAVRLQGRY